MTKRTSKTPEPTTTTPEPTPNGAVPTNATPDYQRRLRVLMQTQNAQRVLAAELTTAGSMLETVQPAGFAARSRRIVTVDLALVEELVTQAELLTREMGDLMYEYEQAMTDLAQSQQPTREPQAPQDN